VDTDTFDVRVVDTVAPVFTSVPQDITTDIYPAGTQSVLVDLGEPAARDSCSGQVLLSHDGPQDGLFTPGVHTVTWTAEDARGNAATATQRVDVRVLARHLSWWFAAISAALVGGVVLGWAWLWATRRSRRRRVPEPSEPGPPPSPQTPFRAAARWLAVTAAVAAVVAASVLAALLLRDHQGGSTALPSTTVLSVTSTSPATGTATTTTLATTSEASTTTAAPPTTLGGPTLNPSGPPTYGDTKLITGFLTDPAPYSIVAGGSVNLSSGVPGGGCPGWAAINPDLRFEWVGSGLLRFYYLPDDPGADGADTVLVIYDPTGTWRCDDDSYGTRHPTIDFNPSQNGTYEVWVGTYSGGYYIPGTLFITEMDANHPS
jgi:hypothetical protein